MKIFKWKYNGDKLSTKRKFKLSRNDFEVFSPNLYSHIKSRPVFAIDAQFMLPTHLNKALILWISLFEKYGSKFCQLSAIPIQKNPFTFIYFYTKIFLIFYCLRPWIFHNRYYHLTWVARVFEQEKNLPQSWHWTSFFPSWTPLICLFKSLIEWNLWPQIVQVADRSRWL